MYPLDPQIKTVWSLARITVGILFTFIAFALENFLLFIGTDIPILPYGVLSASIFVIYTILAIVTPPIMYKYWKFEIRDEELYLERGVLVRIKTLVSYRRIQHLDVRQGVYERMFNLARLVVYTAGTKGDSIFIPGLPLEYAESLRDRLRNYSIEDAV